MGLYSYTANDLYKALVGKEDFLLLDVRNETDHSRFPVEGPYDIRMQNVPYIDFIEDESDSLAKVSKGYPVRIVCAKEGSAQYVGEILASNGFDDVGYLEGGIVSWGNMLEATKINNGTDGFDLYQCIRPGKASCNYIITYKDEMILFDPSRNVPFYSEFAREHGIKIVHSFETHLQADYISGSIDLAKATGCTIHAHDGDFHGTKVQYNPLQDGDTFSIPSGGPEVKIIHTPGHTPGSTTFMINDRYMISGDTVFIESVGRPDLGGKAVEWAKTLFGTLQEKILPMDPDVQVLPGHFISWTEANEGMVFQQSLESVIDHNKDVYSISEEASFVDFIKNNMRKQPDVYGEIRKVNGGFLEVDTEEGDTMDLGKNECAASSHS